MERLLHDIRMAMRTVLKNPAFSITVVICIALGIGANTAIFAVVNEVLLKPLPFPHSDRLVDIREMKAHRTPVRPANYLDWKQRSHSFEVIGVSRDLRPVDLTGNGEPEAITGYRFAHSMFQALDVPPLMGRTFSEQEDGTAHAPVVVISYRLWDRRLARDASIVGKSITLNGTPHTVIGVMPQDFRQPENGELWLPLDMDPASYQDRDKFDLRLVGRLRPGVTMQQASDELNSIAKQLAIEHPETNAGWGVLLRDFREGKVGDIRPTLLILFSAVGLLLLIAVANVANLMLSRMHARTREISVRVALGAGRTDLIRQLLSESLLLSAIGGALGVLCAYWVTRGLVAVFPTHIYNLGIPRVESIPINASVLAFCGGLVLLTGLLFGLPPALHSSSGNVAQSMKDASGSSGISKRSKWLRNALVVAEISIAVVVLIGAGLTIKSFDRLQRMSYGFDPSDVLTMYITMSEKKYPDDPAKRAYMDRLLPALSGTPGVQHAAAIDFLPLSGFDSTTTFTIEGTSPNPQDQPESAFRVVTPAYFAVMRISVLKGRGFNDTDRLNSPLVAVVNERFAKNFFADKDAIGKRVDFGEPGKPHWAQIVGIINDVKHAGLDQDIQPEMYVSYNQSPYLFQMMAFTLRTNGDPDSVVNSARQAIWSVDKDQPVIRVVSMETAAKEMMAIRRVTMLLLAVFGCAALALACVGAYGVISQGVIQRTREIGVRMALGATRGNVLTMILGEGARLAVIGATIGIFLASALTRLMSSLLYGVSAHDPLTFFVIPALLFAVAIIACLIPARRATNVDPMVALRYE
ncbi:MAG: ABC transporter permease [Terriglobales bacterium]